MCICSPDLKIHLVLCAMHGNTECMKVLVNMLDEIETFRKGGDMMTWSSTQNFCDGHVHIPDVPRPLPQAVLGASPKKTSKLEVQGEEDSIEEHFGDDPTEAEASLRYSREKLGKIEEVDKFDPYTPLSLALVYGDENMIRSILDSTCMGEQTWQSAMRCVYDPEISHVRDAAWKTEQIRIELNAADLAFINERLQDSNFKSRDSTVNGFYTSSRFYTSSTSCRASTQVRNYLKIDGLKPEGAISPDMQLWNGDALVEVYNNLSYK